jgi:AcrR family transcriptional regulator
VIPVKTKRYHHGNLREELVRVGLDLAREGGPPAIKLREAARRIGVTPSAAYRHFAGQEGLLLAVKAEVLRELTVAMTAKVQALPEDSSPFAKVRAASAAYFEFGILTTGLYGVLLDTVDNLPHLSRDVQEKVATDLDAVEMVYPSTRFPFTYMLTLVAQTQASRNERFDTALVVWAAVHGITTMCATGPLRLEPVEHKRSLFETTINSIAQGLKI